MRPQGAFWCWDAAGSIAAFREKNRTIAASKYQQGSQRSTLSTGSNGSSVHLNKSCRRHDAPTERDTLRGHSFQKRKRCFPFRQYSGTVGRIENSQIGVFATYASPCHGGARTLIDRGLYLPKAWKEDPEHCRATGVPKEIRFVTKLQLGRGMVERVLAAGLPCVWVVADSVCGSDSAFRRWLEERNQPCVLGVTSRFQIFDVPSREWGKTIVERLPAKA